MTKIINISQTNLIGTSFLFTILMDMNSHAMVEKQDSGEKPDHIVVVLIQGAR